MVNVKSECKYKVCIVCRLIAPLDVIEPPELITISSFVNPKFLYKLDDVKLIVCLHLNLLM